MGQIPVTEVEIATVGDLKSGEMQMIPVKGKEILLACVGEVYYAADNRCPHMGGILSYGTLEGTIVTCPRHGSRFDLRDGRVVRWTSWPAALVAVDQLRSRSRSLHVYTIITEGDKIKIRL
jgi:3-phenylpropionate/trans-cinnamate dioxygenase ferredoxin component